MQRAPSLQELPRSASSPHLHLQRTASFLSANRNLERQLRALQRDVAALRARVVTFEDVNARWGLRYSRRAAIISNALMGVWLFAFRFLQYVRERRGKVLRSVVPGWRAPWRAVIQGSSGNATGSMRSIMYNAYIGGMRHSALFFMAVILLTRKRSWNRIMGTLLGMGCSTYLAVRPVAQGLPWTNLFNIFCNALYLTGMFNADNSDKLPSFMEYVYKQE